MPVKSFITLATVCYKTFILANAASAKSVNYDDKVHCKVEHTVITDVNYACKIFLVQATVVSLTHLLLVGDSCPQLFKCPLLGHVPNRRTDEQTKQAFFKNIFDVFPEIYRQVLFLFCFPVCYIRIR
jgi:hypothetical protein